MVQRAIIEVEGDTSLLDRGLDRAERDVGTLGRAVARSSGSMRSAFSGVGRVIQGVSDAMGIATRGLDLAKRAAEALGVDLTEITQTFTAMIRASLRATEGIGGMDEGMDSLVESIKDGNSAAGKFVREGLAGIVGMGGVIIGTFIEIVNTVTQVIDTVRVATAFIQVQIARVSEFTDFLPDIPSLTDIPGGVIDIASSVIGSDDPETLPNFMASIGEGAEVATTGFEGFTIATDDLASAQQALTDASVVLRANQRTGADTAREFAETVAGIQEAIMNVSAGDINRELARMNDETAEATETMEGFQLASGLVVGTFQALQIQLRAVRIEQEAANARIQGHIQSLLDFLVVAEEARLVIEENTLIKSAGIQQEFLANQMAEADSLAMVWEDAYSQIESTTADSLASTFGAVGAFIGGTENAFKALGASIKNILGSSFSSIGQAMLQASVSAAFSGSPFALIGLLGGTFALLGGLLTGGGGSAISQRPSGSVDAMQAIRPDVGPGRTVIQQSLSVGNIFSADESAAAVDGFMRRSRDHGEGLLAEIGI